MSEVFEKPKGFKKKWENFWYHYKIVFWVVAFFVASAIYLGADVLTKKDPDMVLAYVSQQYGDESQFGRAEEAFKDIVGDINGDGRVRLNYRLMVIKENGISTYDVDMEQQFNYAFIDKNVRLFIIEDKFFTDKRAYFEPLDGIVSPETAKDGLKNDEGQICAIPLAESTVAKKMDFARPELYIALKRITHPEQSDPLVPVQQEKAKEVLKYIIEGNE